MTILVAAGLPLLAWTVSGTIAWWWPNAAVVLTVLLGYPLWSWRRLEASLATLTRETERMAGLLHPGAQQHPAQLVITQPTAGGFRIALQLQAVPEP